MYTIQAQFYPDQCHEIPASDVVCLQGRQIFLLQNSLSSGPKSWPIHIFWLRKSDMDNVTTLPDEEGSLLSVEG